MELGDYEHNAITEQVYLGGIAHVKVFEVEPEGALQSGRRRVLLGFGDELGSTSAVVDKASGELVERITYQAYGATETDYRPKRWGSHRESVRYTGKEDEPEVGITYFGARVYSSALGRWLSPDPLTVHMGGGDLNPYAFVGNSPTNFVDPTGLQAESGCLGMECRPPSGWGFTVWDDWSQSSWMSPMGDGAVGPRQSWSMGSPMMISGGSSSQWLPAATVPSTTASGKSYTTTPELDETVSTVMSDWVPRRVLADPLNFSAHFTAAAEQAMDIASQSDSGLEVGGAYLAAGISYSFASGTSMLSFLQAPKKVGQSVQQMGAGNVGDGLFLLATVAMEAAPLRGLGKVASRGNSLS